MVKYKTQNGWTKEKMIEHIQTNFKGKSFRLKSSSMAEEASQLCAYRGIDGTKCAVGMFIPDEKYRVEMEDKTIIALQRDFASIDVHMPLETEGMFQLQMVHDCSRDVKCLTDMLEWVNKCVED